MNNQRRKKIDKIIDLLDEAQLLSTECENEEQKYIDNMPENLQGGDKFMEAEDTVTLLCDVASSCGGYLEDLSLLLWR